MFFLLGYGLWVKWLMVNWLLVVGCWLWVKWLMVIGYWVMGYGLTTINYQLLFTFGF